LTAFELSAAKRGDFVHICIKKNSFCKDLAAFFLNIDLRKFQRNLLKPAAKLFK